jgi:hypothetical protein
MQNPALARWHAHLHGLVTSIHEISGLANVHQKTGFPLKNPLIFTSQADNPLPTKATMGDEGG